jgi:hypothetical protein
MQRREKNGKTDDNESYPEINMMTLDIKTAVVLRPNKFPAERRIILLNSGGTHIPAAPIISMKFRALQFHKHHKF